MLIINADDWGRTHAETDAVLKCVLKGRVTSASAMVFMDDSERASDLAKENAIDVGLHLNLSQAFTGRIRSDALRKSHHRVTSFLMTSKYALLVYNPFLREAFRFVYQAQADEFFRLYGKLPSHIDGHQHRHLCANVLVDALIPAGEKVRRNFTFGANEKGLINRGYRRLQDRWLAGRYRMTDYFFALSWCLREGQFARTMELAKQANVEIMTHPIQQAEFRWLIGDEFHRSVGDLEVGSYGQM
jgi:chitin disaccharide deacetylase